MRSGVVVTQVLKVFLRTDAGVFEPLKGDGESY